MRMWGSKTSIVGGSFIIVALVLTLVGFSESQQSESISNEIDTNPASEVEYPVLRNVQTIPLGASITTNNVDVFYSTSPPANDAIVNLNNIEGRLALREIAINEPITKRNSTDDPSALGLAHFVPVGMRAIALRVTDEIAVGNFIRPGDFVDLHFVVRPETTPKVVNSIGNDKSPLEPHSYILFQNLRVLTVGPAYKAKAEDINDYRHVTLALTPKEASSLALARSVGTYYLSLRNMHDGEISSASQVAVSDLPELNRGGHVQDANSSRYRVVEIINGSRRQKIEVESD